jgi:hypothetical protein
VINFISKACNNLTILDLTLGSQVNFGPLTNKGMKLESVKLALKNGSKNVVKFLNSFPCLTSLDLTDYSDPLVNHLDLKSLTTLRLKECHEDFLKLLVEATKSTATLKNLEVTWVNREYQVPEFSEDDVMPAIDNLDFVSVLLNDYDPEDVQHSIDSFAVMFQGNYQSKVNYDHIINYKCYIKIQVYIVQAAISQYNFLVGYLSHVLPTA